MDGMPTERLPFTIKFLVPEMEVPTLRYYIDGVLIQK
jgi:hypothetical protein